QSQPLDGGRPSIADELIAARDSKLANADVAWESGRAHGSYSEKNGKFQKVRKGKLEEKARRGRGVVSFASKPSGKVIGKIRGGDSVAAVSAKGKSAESLNKRSTYTVQPGDTLWSIARKHSVDVEQLAKWNGVSAKTGVKAGQNLVLWNKDAAKKLAIASSGIKSSQSISYTIRQGDTLFSISKRFKVSVADLRKWNGSKIEKHIQPGTSIMVQVERD
ncbi:LysM peptidoglycan-binding domain-containing protein, partial [Methylocaldum sp.]